MFWLLAKWSDLSCRHDFEKSMDVIISYVNDHDSLANGEKKQRAIDWLMTLWAKKAQWASCYTWKNATLGIHSTVRSEAINSVIASFCQVKTDMCTLIGQLENMVYHQILKKDFEKLRSQFSAKVQNNEGGTLMQKNYVKELLHTQLI